VTHDDLVATIYEGLGEAVGSALVVPLLSRGKDRCWRVRRIAEGCAKAEAGQDNGSSVVLDEAHVLECCLPCKVFPVEGFLWADNFRSSRPLHEDLLPLGLFLRHADLMLENAVLYEELSKITIMDALTGVYNRAYFNYLVQVEAERSLRYTQCAAVILIDIHGLRRINEAAGQAAGDRLLSVMGELIRSKLRRIDFVARYGGDEFAVLLPHTDSDRALRVAKRLHRAIAEHPFNLPHLDEPLQCCSGLAVIPEHASDPDAVVALADFALHEAQTLGPGTVMRMGDPKPAEVK
jgi:diguanylate cyclase (GGDEF)-like protein